MIKTVPQRIKALPLSNKAAEFSYKWKFCCLPKPKEKPTFKTF